MAIKKQNESSTPVKTKVVSKVSTVPAKRRGRPPGSKDSYRKGKNIYTKQVPEMVLAFLKKGYSRDVISAHLGITRNTLFKWEKEHPALAQAIEDGTVHSQLFWETLGIRAVQGRIKGFNATAWIFNMKNRFGWKDKTELSGDEERPISVRVVKFSEMQETQEKVLEPEWRKIENLEPDNSEFKQ